MRRSVQWARDTFDRHSTAIIIIGDLNDTMTDSGLETIGMAPKPPHVDGVVQWATSDGDFASLVRKFSPHDTIVSRYGVSSARLLDHALANAAGAAMATGPAPV